MPAPASNTAMGLNFPRMPATVEGSPNTPLPMMELMTSAVRLQRPMARRSWWVGLLGWVSGIARFYHKLPMLGLLCDRVWWRLEFVATGICGDWAPGFP